MSGRPVCLNSTIGGQFLGLDSGRGSNARHCLCAHAEGWRGDKEMKPTIWIEAFRNKPPPRNDKTDQANKHALPGGQQMGAEPKNTENTRLSRLVRRDRLARAGSSDEDRWDRLRAGLCWRPARPIKLEGGASGTDRFSLRMRGDGKHLIKRTRSPPRRHREVCYGSLLRLLPSIQCVRN